MRLANILIKRSPIFILSIIIWGGCSKESNPVDNTPPDLPDKLYDVQASYIQSIDYFPDVTPLVQYDVAVYQLTYPTTHQGTQIAVSGTVVIPGGVSRPAIIVDCHGTIRSDDSAPTHSTAGRFRGERS